MERQENSKHISMWINNELLAKSEENQKKLNLKSRSEYVEKALEFYNGYLKDKNNEEYINSTVVQPMDKMLKRLENRIAKLMFKQSVESSKLFWLLVKGLNLNPEDVDLLHEDCVQEVKRINGAIRFPYEKYKDEDDDRQND